MQNVKQFQVIPCTRQEIAAFIEQHHYSHNINGVISTYCFKLMDGSTLIGAATFGSMAMRNAYKKYSEHESDIIELRRLCCVDNTPKNTESYFIGKMLRWLKSNTNLKLVISYADQTYGHSGIIYKASNFKQVGFTAPMRVIRRLEDGKLFHDKTVRTKYKGVLKPFAVRLQGLLDCGRAIYEKTLPKVVYLYELKR